MRAAVCDDEKRWREENQQILEYYAAKTGLDLEVVSFGSKEELLGQNDKPIDAVFMDIDLKVDNGIEVAKEINEKWPNCQVVFVTNFLHYATEAYSAEHSFFVLKEQFEDKVNEIFQKLLHEREQIAAKLVFQKVGGDKLSLCSKDVHYFERDKRVTHIHSVWGVYDVWDKLGDIDAHLSKIDFVRCHNSYIVYLPRVRELQKHAFYMEDGMKIPISRRYLNDAKESFMMWALMKMS